MYVVVDCETTGLDPKEDYLLELGIVITDDSFNTIASKSWVVKNPSLTIVQDEDGEWCCSNLFVEDIVNDMHRDNGLWEKCSFATQWPTDVENDAIKFLMEHEAGGQPMCGSSIHFDRAFLKSEMPLFEEVFHYRNIDTSTIKNMAERLNPIVFEGRPRGQKLHRVLPDCDDTIEELQYYVNSFFIVDPTMPVDVAEIEG